MHRTIEITVAPTGEVTIEATGFTGGACERATAEIEKALGVVRSRKKKPEYFAMTSNRMGMSNRQQT